MVAALFLMAASWVSNVLLAAAVTRPRRSAVIVATSPIPRRTTSCDSLLRCGAGSQPRTNVPARALPKVQMNVMEAIVMARTIVLIKRISVVRFDETPQTRADSGVSTRPTKE